MVVIPILLIAIGVASVQGELERLESEEEQLKRSLSDLAKRQAPVERVSDDARSFLESWQDVGELLEAATPEERLQILQHYIEVVEVGPIDPQTRTGTYAMRLFPEVRPDRGFDFGSGDNGPNDPTPAPQTTNGAIPANGNGSALVNPGRLGSHNRPESSPSRTRTYNLPVNSRPLLPLSYRGSTKQWNYIGLARYGIKTILVWDFLTVRIVPCSAGFSRR